MAEAAALAQVPRDDQALAPLQAAQEWLTGRFQREELLSFRALAEEAYIAKKLTDQTYQELCQWQAHCLSQLEDDVMTRERYSREYSGFYYWPSQETSNKARLYLDGQPQLVYEKQDLLRAQGCRLTPILRKTYWLGSMSENKLSRARFQQEAEKLWHSPLGTAVEALAALPPAVRQLFAVSWPPSPSKSAGPNGRPSRSGQRCGTCTTLAIDQKKVFNVCKKSWIKASCGSSGA